MWWYYYPDSFSSYEEYIVFLKNKEFAIDIDE